MEFQDAVEIIDRRTTADGYLVAHARVARAGIQTYRGYEMDRADMETVRVYRPADEVFAKDSLASFAHKPITNDHPPTQVTAVNWRDHAAGIVGDEVARDGEYVRVPLMLADAGAIADLASGKRELSAGYVCQIDWTQGVTPTGEAYDAVQRGIRINHVALVSAGRAGPACRIGDRSLDSNGGRRMTDKTKSITVDGITIEATDQAVQVIMKLQSTIKDMEGEEKKREEELDKAKKDHAEALAKKDGEIAGLKAQIPDAVKLDALLTERGAVIDAAKQIAPQLDAAGKSIADIRRSAVAAKLGDAAVKDRADAYVEGLFDSLAKTAAPDALRDAIRTRAGDSEKSGYAGYVADLNGAWKGDRKESR